MAVKYGMNTKHVLKNNARLNSMFLDETEFFLVNNHMGVSERMQVGRKLYRPNYSVEILSNLKFTTTAQKQADADKILSMVMQVPQMAQNQAIVHKALVGFLKANEQDDMIPLLGAAPPPPPQLPLPPPPEPPEGTAPQGPPLPQG